jgi:competence protein ComEA
VLANAVNTNSADAATSASKLKGIGCKRAQVIVEKRNKHGPFRSVDELYQGRRGEAPAEAPGRYPY